MSDTMDFKIDTDKVTLGFLYDLEEASASQSLRAMVDLFVNELGLDRKQLRALKPAQMKDLAKQIQNAAAVGNENG